MTLKNPGIEAIEAKGWMKAHQWLILRRLCQIGILGAFLLGPLAGIWIVEGNLTSSMTLDFLPLTDPFVALQSIVSGHIPETTALIGVAIVAIFYMLVGGRVYCSWVCPINIVTDAAHYTRSKLDLPKGWQPKASTRYWVLGMVLVVSAVSGTIAWELVNPISILHRGLIFTMGLGWLVVAVVFLFDLFVSRRGWCGHLCPVGAFYGLLGAKSMLRVSAKGRSACDDCMDCFAVCPEPHVITPALKGAEKNVSPVILSTDCSNCGRCIDVCKFNIFQFTARHNQAVEDPHLDGLANAADHKDKDRPSKAA